jgi:hypothetical protein
MTAEIHPIDKEQVMAYLDGELMPDEAARVAQHIDQCPICAELAANLRSISSQLIGWNVEPAPRRLSEAVFENLNKKDESARPRTRVQKSSLRQMGWVGLLRNRWGWGGVGLVVLASFGAMFFQPRQARFAALAPPPAASLAARKSDEFDRLQGYAKLVEESGMTDEKDKFQGQVTPVGPMIARTASLNISVKDFSAARAALEKIVSARQGYVSSLDLSTEKDSPQSLKAKVAIPAAQYDAALSDLRALGRVAQEQQSSEEVSAQVVDLDARLKSARETESQLAEILRTRTGKVADVLEVEREMARVRGEIEGMEAEQKQLRNRIAFASINVNLSEEYQAQLGGKTFGAARQVRNALVDGYHSAAAGLLSVCVFLLSVGPSLLLWGLILFWPARWAWRRWRSARAETIGGA